MHYFCCQFDQNFVHSLGNVAGGFEIISGGVDGIVTSFHPHDSLWRCNIGEESARLYNGNAVSYDHVLQRLLPINANRSSIDYAVR